MFVNNPERLTASLLTSTVLTMTLLSSGVNAADEPFDSSLFEAEASGTSVAVALAQAVQQVRNEFDSSSNSTHVDEGVLTTTQAEYELHTGSTIDWEHCAIATLDTMSPIENQMIVCGYPPATHNENPPAQKIPTTEEILYGAAAVIHANGAGLYKRPLGVSYTNKFIPSIVAVTSPTQTHVINLLGHDITITLTATSYEWSWGDGTPNLVTTSTGSVWQDGMDLNTDPRLIRHYYTPPQGWRSMLDGPYPHEDREITLTTTWSGTLTNPFTGETQTISGLVTTKETTGKFPLSHLVINNTDTWEEKQGH